MAAVGAGRSQADDKSSVSSKGQDGRAAYIQTGTAFGQASGSSGAQGGKRRFSNFAEAAQAVHKKVSILSKFKKLTGNTSESEATPSIPAVKKENTYQLGPDAEVEFSSCRVQNTLNEVLERLLKTARYNPEKAPKLACLVSQVAKEEVKKLGFKRHKVIVNTILGENSGQGIQTASRCLWSHNTDSYATASYRNASLFVVITVFGVYHD